jgi:hypothetical protein
MKSGARTAIALFGGAAVLVLAVGCGGGSKSPGSTTTTTTSSSQRVVDAHLHPLAAVVLAASTVRRRPHGR